jgi:Na+-driven multidrug efflux pump
MATFQALGKAVPSMVIIMGRQFLFFIPLLYLLTHFFGFSGYTWVQPTADILTTGIAVVLGLSLVKVLRGADGTTNKP